MERAEIRKTFREIKRMYQSLRIALDRMQADVDTLVRRQAEHERRVRKELEETEDTASRRLSELLDRLESV